MKKGAADYILKPFAMEELVNLCGRLAERQKLTALSRMYSGDLKNVSCDRFIGKSPAAKTMLDMIAKVAPTDTTVLLTGKSGTGKELAARMVHDLSPRKGRPFIAVNCAALTETLLESELFGHEKGSFTGAVGRKRGRFELAHGGSIFLDEIAETTPGFQSKLLRVLEERTLYRVGGVDAIDIDVRVIAATNRDLKEYIAAGGFREDLFYRLNVFPVHMPDLSERREDIVELAEHFIQTLNYPHSGFETPVADILRRYDWPGNIRELKNVIERATILAGGEPLSVDDFSLEVDDAPLGSSADGGSSEGGLEAAEKKAIVEALAGTGGNKTDAARLLRISRRRLYSRMKILGIK